MQITHNILSELNIVTLCCQFILVLNLHHDISWHRYARHFNRHPLPTHRLERLWLYSSCISIGTYPIQTRHRVSHRAFPSTRCCTRACGGRCPQQISTYNSCPGCSERPWTEVYTPSAETTEYIDLYNGTVFHKFSQDRKYRTNLNESEIPVFKNSKRSTEIIHNSNTNLIISSKRLLGSSNRKRFPSLWLNRPKFIILHTFLVAW